MRLRKWQQECSQKALELFSGGQRQFLCLATPGAGKTVMAAEVARQLINNDMVDHVICLSPSNVVSEGIRRTFEQHTGFQFDGLIGSIGGSFTYQSKKVRKGFVKRLLEQSRVLAVFDEIHHCAGNELEHANSWASDIIEIVADNASFLMSMTGTPWRSDSSPITLANYDPVTGEVICDYKYGLAQAINDRVCRSPTIVVTDNSNITLDTGAGELKAFKGFSDLLSNSSCSYQNVVENDLVIRHMLNIANARLGQIRKDNTSAAGLVVASNVAHARKIHSLLRNELGVSAEIATYADENPAELINLFRTSNAPWIVSVGMVSEGTDIPRLQVCCHLTRVKTELYFRQILGRVLRITNTSNQEAVLYMPAESKLIEYAQRLQQDVPLGSPPLDFQFSDVGVTVKPLGAEWTLLEGGITPPPPEHLNLSVMEERPGAQNRAADQYQQNNLEISIYGQFYEEVVSSFSYQF